MHFFKPWFICFVPSDDELLSVDSAESSTAWTFTTSAEALEAMAYHKLTMTAKGKMTRSYAFVTVICTIFCGMFFGCFWNFWYKTWKIEKWKWAILLLFFLSRLETTLYKPFHLTVLLALYYCKGSTVDLLLKFNDCSYVALPTRSWALLLHRYRIVLEWILNEAGYRTVSNAGHWETVGKLVYNAL